MRLVKLASPLKTDDAVRAAPGETAVPGESMTSLGTGHGRRTRRAKRVPFSGNEPDRCVRLYVQDVEGGTPKAITPEGMHATAFLVSHDGQSVARHRSGPTGLHLSHCGRRRPPDSRN